MSSESLTPFLVHWLKDWIQQRLAYMDAYLNTYGILLANEPEKLLKILNSYPNPSTNDFTIDYQVLERGQVKLQVIDPLGRAIAELVNQNQAAGQYQINWKPNQSGSYIIDYQKDNVPVERLRVVKF